MFTSVLQAAMAMYECLSSSTEFGAHSTVDSRQLLMSQGMYRRPQLFKCL